MATRLLLHWSPDAQVEFLRRPRLTGGPRMELSERQQS
jgi:hypothetical protein